jgi:hypothetical protein
MYTSTNIDKHVAGARVVETELLLDQGQHGRDDVAVDVVQEVDAEEEGDREAGLAHG